MQPTTQEREIVVAMEERYSQKYGAPPDLSAYGGESYVLLLLLLRRRLLLLLLLLLLLSHSFRGFH